MRVMVLVLGLVLAPTPAFADEQGFDLELDFSSDLQDLLLHLSFVTADVGVVVIDLRVEERKRSVGALEIALGGTQVLVYGYRFFKDDDDRGLDGLMAVCGTLFIARGVYLSVKPVEKKPTFVPTMIAGRPGLALAGRF